MAAGAHLAQFSRFCAPDAVVFDPDQQLVVLRLHPDGDFAFTFFWRDSMPHGILHKGLQNHGRDFRFKLIDLFVHFDFVL